MTPYRDRSGRAGAAAPVAASAMLLVLATALGYVEAVLLPSLPVAGLKVGLANIAVVLCLVMVGPRWALAVTAGRLLLVGLATGSLGGPAFAMACAGALAAWAVMTALSGAGGRFSVYGVSVGGSAAHVLAQLALASALVGSSGPMLLAPLSVALSVLSGLAVGFASDRLLSISPHRSVAFATR